MSHSETTAAANTPRTRREDRPLSPHLSIYKPQISSVLSIMHRLTGFALALGTVVLVAWLWGLAYNVSAYECVTDFVQSIPGTILLMGWTWAFFFHLANGLRHLFWDIGKGFTLPALHTTGWMVVFFSFILTAVTWYLILQREGE